MTIATIDVETSGLDATGNKFILGVLYFSNSENYTFTKKEQLWNKIIEEGKKEHARKRVLTVYGHNIAYDIWNIIPRTDKRIKFYSDRPLIMEYIDTDNKIVFLDTMNLFKMSLEKAGQIIGTNKGNIPIELLGDESPKNLNRIKGYCIQDCKVTMELVHEVKRMLIQDEIRIKRIYTINQVAIQYFLNKLREYNDIDFLFADKERKYLHRTKYNGTIKDAYRGGRVEAFRTGLIKDVKYIDCNNLYGYSAMNMKFPDLRTEEQIKSPLNIYDKDTVLDNIGISKVALKNVSNKIGLIQVRTDNSIYYPKEGTIIIGTYTNQEIKEALNEGYELIDIEKTTIWDEAKYNPYNTYITDLYTKRITARDEFKKYFYKQMMNSSFGKLAQHRTEQVIFIDTVEKAEEYIKENTEIIRAVGLDYVYKKEKLKAKEKKYHAPIIPTMINAYARIYMYRAMKEIGVNNLIYTDTDSIIYKKCDDSKIPFGTNIGQFKIEHDNAEILLYGRKTYRIDNEIKISGIPKKQLSREAFDEGYVKFSKMIGRGDTAEIDKIGLFKDEIRDLKQQQEDYEGYNKTLKDKKMYIDKYTNDISYFLNKIKTFI